MNVLILATDVFKKGGIQRYTRYQIQALKENPYLDKVFVFSILNKNPKNIFEEEIEIDYIAGGTSFFKKIIFIIKVLFFCKKNNINLIICNHISLGQVAFFIKKISGISYTVNVYGLEIWSGLRRFEILGLKNADGVIGVSNFTLNYIEKELNIKLKKRFLLYNCIDIKRFIPFEVPNIVYKKYGIPKDKKIIITVGRLDRDKGQETIIKSLKMFSDDIFYIIVGDGINRNKLERLAKSEGVTNKVVFTGRVPEEYLVSFYNIADVLVLIGKFAKGEGEGFGFALIEASACGKPVIGGNEDGSIEAVLDGKTGFSLSPDDFEGITRKIKILIDKPRRAKKMGMDGRKYVEENFSYKTFLKKQSDIIKKVLFGN